ncbi:MAG: peptidase S9 [Bacteroidota bacterium]
MFVVRPHLWMGALLLLLLGVPSAQAQYFGRNKVQYDNFEFKQFDTEHFTFFFYPESEEAVMDAARMAERWYERHSLVYLRQFADKKPIILYANDADFHQTNIINGTLGEGTGGVTESLKQRVVMPLTGHYAETDHVLGHELVHSFQYDIAFAEQGGEEQVRFNLRNIPLWFIEGTAEYLSVGRDDAHTAMWLRDAVLRDDLPTIDDLTNKPYQYFPYRYGQAYMAYIGGKYGDVSVSNLYKLAGRTGLDTAFVHTLGIEPDSLSTEWAAAIKDAYLPFLSGRTPAAESGREIVSREEEGGRYNIAPVLSPDGRYVAFLSEKDLFSINLFIADTRTGEVIQKLSKRTADSHFDSMRFISTAGTWSPDGKQFAFITFANGDNEIAIWNLDSGKIDRRIHLGDVSALLNLAWSPDGQFLAISGMNGGISDLYVLDLDSNEVRQLTEDRYADLQPVWSPDGTQIAFVSDRGTRGTDFDRLAYGDLTVSMIDVEAGEIQSLDLFDRGVQHNPQFSPDGKDLFFISNHDGFKDIYRAELNTKEVYAITNLQTGASGITATAPAMSIASQSGIMAFSVYGNNAYTIYSLDAEETEGNPLVNASLMPGVLASTGILQTDGLAAAIGGDEVGSAGATYAGLLPPMKSPEEGIVGAYLSDAGLGLPENPEYDIKEYSSRLKLDYVAPPSVGVSVGGPFGAGLGGSLGFYFSDMLGNHNLTVSVLANGTLKDVGGQVAYLNQKRRLNYGFYGAHIPVIFGYTGGFSTAGDGSLLYNELIQRLFIQQVGSYASYPISTTRRIEVSAGMARYGFDYQVRTFDQIGNRTSGDSGIQEPDPLYLGQVGVAYVKDTANFGFVSPLNGTRQRVQVSPSFGTDSFVTLTTDYRQYFHTKPFTFAFRGLHIGNYGADENAVFGNEYLGSTYYQGFVRGYNLNNFSADECSTAACPESSRLSGTRIAMASAEIRMPLLGNEQIGLINFPYLPTELTLFADIGMAWTAEESPEFTLSRNATGRSPVASAGISSRFLLFGAAILEVYYAYPFQRPEKGAHFGLQLSPGW